MVNKKILCSSILASIVVAANAYAADPGVYVGGQLGVGDIHQNGLNNSDVTPSLSANSTSQSGNSTSDTGLAGRLFAGYQFNDNWATELGWTKFSNMHTSAYNSSTDFDTGDQISTRVNGRIQTNAIDLVAKGILPIQAGFSVYGKLGAAYLIEKATISGTKGVNGISTSSSGSETNKKLYPTFGAGVSYDLTQNVVTDISWNRIQKVGSDNDLASTDLFSVGLAYHFE